MSRRKESRERFYKWFRKRLDKRYHWLHKYKCAKGCEICGWKPNEKYITVHNGVSVGFAFVFDHIDPATKDPQLAGRLGMVGMAALTSKIAKTPAINRKHRRRLFNEIRKCRIVCTNCHSIISQDQTKRSIEIYEERTGEKYQTGKYMEKLKKTRTLSSQTNLNQFF